MRLGPLISDGPAQVAFYDTFLQLIEPRLMRLAHGVHAHVHLKRHLHIPILSGLASGVPGFDVLEQLAQGAIHNHVKNRTRPRLCVPRLDLLRLPQDVLQDDVPAPSDKLRNRLTGVLLDQVPSSFAEIAANSGPLGLGKSLQILEQVRVGIYGTSPLQSMAFQNAVVSVDHERVFTQEDRSGQAGFQRTTDRALAGGARSIQQHKVSWLRLSR